MEHENLNFVHKDGSIFAGAIFMSNRSTKRECFQRNLFGLPHSKAKFLKQVKAGMILFLFEHEERKLYGVFEATSDGALNIIPDAFKSSGYSYPAQILFKRIWVCRPLCEDEFRSAIGDNYYSPNKFHFGLSYEQVTNLIHLFYSRKLNLNQDQKPVIPDIIIERFQNSPADNASSTELRTYVECEPDEYGRERRSDIRRQCASPQSFMDIPKLSYPQHPYSETFNPQQNSTRFSDDHVTFHHDPVRPLARQPACYTDNLDDMAVPYDPDVPHFNLIPKTVDIRDDCPEFQHTYVHGARPNQFFELPDYIPLFEEPQPELVGRDDQNSGMGNYEYISSASLSSCIPNTCKKISRAFHGDVAILDDHDGLNYNLRTVADDDPLVIVDRRLHSDSDRSRTSVFSRLSRDQNVRKHESSPETSTGLSLEQLFNMLATRRERWSTRKVPEELTERGGNQKKIGQTVVQPGERSNSEQTETDDAGCVSPLQYELHDDEAEASFELPFYNFRRRNVDRKCELQGDANACSDISGCEDKPVKSKRRRILRPTLHQEKHNAGGEAEMKEETEAMTAAQLISENEVDNQANCGKIAVDGDVPGDQTIPESDQEGELVEVDHAMTSARVITKNGVDNQANCGKIAVDGNVPADQTIPESDPEGESVEVDHAIFIDGTEDYIPLG